MSKLKEIDSGFIDEYILTHRNKLSKPTMGGTDWRFADIVAPAFREILEISKPVSFLEIGFNIGGSALMFLSIDPNIRYDSVDINENEKSAEYISSIFKEWRFLQEDSKYILPGKSGLYDLYDIVFLDGDHSKEGVIADIESALRFNPEYILFDDVLHRSHLYIHEIITKNYAHKLEIVKLYEFNQLWEGYSMALCKVKK